MESSSDFGGSGQDGLRGPKDQKSAVLEQLYYNFRKKVCDEVTNLPTGNPKNYLLSKIKEEAVDIRDESKLSNADFAETVAGLLLDPISFSPIGIPVVLDTGHTLDQKTYDELKKNGLHNPIDNQSELALAPGGEFLARSNVTTQFIVDGFIVFCTGVRKELGSQNLTITKKDLPEWLKELMDSPDFDAYLDGRRSKEGQSFPNRLVEAEGDEKEEEGEQAEAKKWQALSKRANKLLKKLSPEPSSFLLYFALFLLFASGAVLFSVGLSPFVTGMVGYQAFILFVAANGLGGAALAGIILGVGILMMLGVVAYLIFRPKPLSAAGAAMNPCLNLNAVQAEAMVGLLEQRNNNQWLYPSLVAVGLKVAGYQAASKANSEGEEEEVEDSLSMNIFEICAEWVIFLLKDIWATSLGKKAERQIGESISVPARPNQQFRPLLQHLSSEHSSPQHEVGDLGGYPSSSVSYYACYSGGYGQSRPEYGQPIPTYGQFHPGHGQQPIPLL